jgi:hypothetical protein
MKNEENLRALLAEARELMGRNRLLLGEYEGPQELSKLTNRIDAALAEPVGDVDAFRRGVAAMRKAAVARCDEMATDFRRRRTRNDELKGMGAELCAAAIETTKGLPDPKDTP